MNAAGAGTAKRTPDGRSGWTGPLRPVEWCSLVVLIAGIVWALVVDPSRGPAGAFTDHVRIDVLPNGQSAARVDDAAIARAFADAGLPDPPALDGIDPIPLAEVARRYEAWCATGDESAVMDLGKLWIALDHHRPALECFAAVAARHPDDVLPTYFVGVEAQTLGMDDLADAALQSCARLDPAYFTTFARLGRLALGRGDLDDAAGYFERTRDLVPDLSLGHVGLGRVALIRGDAQSAVAHLLEAIRVTPNDFRAYRFLGQALARMGRDEDARRATRRAEQIPQYAGWLTFDKRLQTAHALANTQRYLENGMRSAHGEGDSEAVIRIAEELLRRRPEDHTTWGTLATTAIKLRRFDEARTAIDRAIALTGGTAPTLCVSAQIWMLQGNQTQALVVVGEAIALDSESATAWDVRGRVCFLSEQFDEATAAMDRAIALEPGNVSRRFALGVMYQQMRRNDAARAVFSALLEIQPGHGPARARLDALESSG
jgi:Flp pilus assembly protein TadD